MYPPQRMLDAALVLTLFERKRDFKTRAPKLQEHDERTVSMYVHMHIHTMYVLVYICYSYMQI